MVFSTNQVRQLYVVKEATGTASKNDGVVTDKSNAGAVAVKVDKNKNLYFIYKGATGVMRSDIINADNIISAKATAATDATQKHFLKQVVVTLDPNVNGGNPIGGQDYILRIVINPYVGMSDEEPYIKYGAVHAVRGMKPAEFYKKLASSLFKNFSRELGKMLEFTIAGKVIARIRHNAAGEEVLVDTDGADITVAEEYTDGVTITEAEQEWTLGIKEQTYVNFTVIPTSVTFDGDEVTWGKAVVSNSSAFISNGKKIADLEYFCMGERGDQYRNIGWPNSIPTKYLVDPTASYNVLDIHYYFVDGGESPQKSEKDITIVCTDKTVLNKLIGQFNTASGKTIATLS